MIKKIVKFLFLIFITSVIVTGCGEFTMINIENATVSDIPDFFYTGEPIKPSVSVTVEDYVLKENKDYTISYENNIEVGEATIILKGIGDAFGSKTVHFQIVNQVDEKTSIVNADILNVESEYYDKGEPITPIPIVKLNGTTLKKDTDYNVYYENNNGIGMATIRIKGINDYCDETTINFEIKKKEPQQPVTPGVTPVISCIGDEANPLIYNGSFQDIATCTNGTITEHQKEKNAGNYLVKCVSNSDKTEAEPRNCSIKAKNISNADIGDIETIVQNQDNTINVNIDPTVTLDGITLVRGSDYQVITDNPTEPGPANVTIQGINNYTGFAYKKYFIASKTCMFVSNKMALVIEGKEDKDKLNIVGTDSDGYPIIELYTNESINLLVTVPAVCGKFDKRIDDFGIGSGQEGWSNYVSQFNSDDIGDGNKTYIWTITAKNRLGDVYVSQSRAYQTVKYSEINYTIVAHVKIVSQKSNTGQAPTCVHEWDSNESTTWRYWSNNPETVCVTCPTCQQNTYCMQYYEPKEVQKGTITVVGTNGEKTDCDVNVCLTTDKEKYGSSCVDTSKK